MIGDWVQIRHGRKLKLELDQFYAQGCHEFREHPIDYFSTFDPIPLTEEILEMNGFEIYEHGDPIGCLWYIKGTTMLFEATSLPTRFWYKWTMADGSHTPRMGILSVQYVHELQHALRLCGLINLADNFKIE